jgi:hypothetical protein
MEEDMFIKHRHYISCLIILMAIIFCFPSCAPVGKQYLQRGEPAPNSATIYAMRAKQFQGGGSDLSFYDGPVHVGELGKNDYLVWSRPAGTAELCAYSPHNRGFNPVPLLLDVKAGRSYYVSVELLINIGGPYPISIHEIDESIARERMKSIDIAPKAEVVFTWDKAVAAADKWPGPATRENRWNAAWPKIRGGMSIEELKSIGIFLLDTIQPDGMFNGSITSTNADGSTSLVMREYNEVRRTNRVVISNDLSVVLKNEYSPDQLIGLPIPFTNKYYGIIDKIKEVSSPSILDEIVFGFSGYSIQLRQNKVVSVDTRKQRNPTR